MPYRFERLDTATSPEQLRQLLPEMERRQYDCAQYVAVQCYATAVGPPMSRGKAAPWYDDFDPDQLYLPFEGFTPVEVQSIYNNFSPELGEGWVICYSHPNSRRHRELVFHERQTCEPNRILSLSVFKRVSVAEGASRPFVQFSRTSGPSSTSTRRRGGSPSLPSRELIELAMQPRVRDALQVQVGSLITSHEEVVLAEDGMFRVLLDGRVVARLIHGTVNTDRGDIEFTLGLRGHHSRANIRVDYREAALHHTNRW